MTASKKSTIARESDVNIETPKILRRYRRIRDFSRALCEPLATEDFVVQSMPDVSPTKWHLAHTTWFFETFVLEPNVEGYRSPHPQFKFLFNSYYNTIGAQHYRPHRGLITRPTVADVFDYRAQVDDCVQRFLEGDAFDASVLPIVDVGLHHEQQHQELMLTDIKHVFSMNPLRPVYRDRAIESESPAAAMRWLDIPGGVHWIGHDGEDFAYDNESPRHEYFLRPFRVGSRLVTNEEYLAFMADGGYDQPRHWLSEGWQAVQASGWRSPLYWEERDGGWWNFTLAGMRKVDPSEPVCHVSYFEADAYARWAGKRLATEFEWEVAAAEALSGNFVDDGRCHVAPAGVGTHQFFGDAWEWTQSAYAPYPGYRPVDGALGEYNGKFMCNQYVLRGGSCATSRDHIRRTYRNFFPAHSRWQFSGIRLADDSGA